MAPEHRGATSRGLLFVSLCCGLWGVPSWAADRDPGTALVRQALACELAGDPAQRQTLLEQGAQLTPECSLAHWQLGQLFWEGSWQTPEAIQRQAHQDARLEQYRQLREQTPLTAEGQAALARWCRKNHLDEEQRVHWIGVLRDLPNDTEALQALNRLGWRPFQGRLRTPGEIAQLKAQGPRENWRPLVSQWHDAARVEGEMPAPLREKIPQISTLADMQALNQYVGQSVGKNYRGETSHRMLQQLVEALAQNPYPASAEALWRYAVASDFDDVRQAAIVALKQHPQDHYVPRLLAVLRGELESSLQFALAADGRLIAHESRFQEGALSDAHGSLDQILSGRNQPVVFHATPQMQATMAYKHQEAVQRSQRQAEQAQAAHQAAVARANEAIAARNTRVAAVLRATTGQELDNTLTAWWDWWQNYQEQTSPSDRQQQTSTPEDARQSRWLASYADSGVQEQTWRDQSSPASGNATYYYRSHSCFAPGTPVWTLTGLVPIETIQMGDRVLSQNPESGELAFKPVLAVTVREDGPRMQVDVEGETLLATGSHPFWVSGQGWRLAKELQRSDRLHTLAGSAPVTGIQGRTAAEAGYSKAHNLILPEFHTFFVGAQGILVHDNTTRTPTANLVPGLPPSIEDEPEGACPSP